VAWVEEFLSIGWDTRRLREGRTFLAPKVGLVAGIATAMEDIHAHHRAVLEAALRRALTDLTLPAAVPNGMPSRCTPSSCAIWKCVPADG
jgi:hypothetical protein